MQEKIDELIADKLVEILHGEFDEGRSKMNGWEYKSLINPSVSLTGTITMYGDIYFSVKVGDKYYSNFTYEFLKPIADRVEQEGRIKKEDRDRKYFAEALGLI